MTGAGREQVLGQLRQVCDQMARVHQLSSDQADELYAHMEDKALAYMQGDESLTEEDIALLVREHFGNPYQIEALVGPPAAGGAAGVVRALTRSSAATAHTDLWGIWAFPWYGRNLIFGTVAVFLAFEIASGVLAILRGMDVLRTPLWVLILLPVAGVAMAAVRYIWDRGIQKRLQQKRSTLRGFTELDTEGIFIHGVVECPAIFQAHDGEFTATPLIGEQVVVKRSDVVSFRTGKLCNGRYYFGKNGGFRLAVRGREDERITSVVPWPDRWYAWLRTKE